MNYVFSDRLKNLSGNAIREIFKLVSAGDVISFAGGLPATQCLPVDLVNKFAAEILSGDKASSVLQYGATEGYMPLRTKMTDYIKRTGISGISEENILIISGGQQGIDLTFKAFLNKGDNILVENPTYLAVLHIAKTYEANALGLKTEEDGVDLNDLEQNIKKYNPKIFYIVPNFQNPTGKTLSLIKRKKIAEICARYNVIVIEDDPYRELRYSGEPLPSIKSFDKQGCVVYVTSFSKVISPALRTGAAIANENIIRKLTIGKQAVDVHTVTLSQAIAHRFICDDTLDNWVKSSIPLYKSKRDAMIKALDQFMPKSFKHTIPEGGLFIWGEFAPESGINASKEFLRALENKVAYVSGNDFFADGSGSNCMRLNFSNATEENIYTGVERLGKIFNK
jgi:2-aminoadipate transaminase